MNTDHHSKILQFNQFFYFTPLLARPSLVAGERNEEVRTSYGGLLWIMGEAKHNLTMREVEKFARTVDMARRNLEGEIFPVCFCYRARPEVQERIRELGFHIIFSYGELVESGTGSGQ